MLTSFRNFAKSPIAVVLFALLIIAMAGFGVTQYGFSAISGNEVIKAGSRTVSPVQFRQEYDNYKKRIEEQQQRPISAEEAAANQLDAIVLNGVAAREAFAELLHRAGIRPSDKLVVSRIQEVPAFFDPVTGRFDRKTYEARLAENNLTPALFDRTLRDETAAQHFVAGAGNGLVLPKAYGALAAIFALETRDIAFFQVTPQTVGEPPRPTDAQLTAFMQQNARALTRPETRVLTVVRFSPQAQAAGPVDEAEVQRVFNFRKDTLSRPETRSIVRIPAKDAAAAQQITARLARNETPAAIAKAFGVEPVSYEDKPKTAIPDKKLANAAFAMQAGQVSTVQGDLGLAVVKVVSVSPGRAVTLDEVRPMIEAEVRKDAATAKVYTQTEAYDAEHQKGAGLAAAAQKVGAPVFTIGPVTQQGLNAEGQPTPGLHPRILEVAFGLPSGGESELSETGEGEYFAVKVERVTPPSMPPLAEVRNELTAAWMRQEMARRLEAKANELAARLRKGEAMEAVAASVGAQVSRLANVSRQTAGEIQNAPREVLARAFGAKPNEPFTAPTQGFTIAVGTISNVQMSPSPIAVQAADSQRVQMSQEVFREMAQAAQAGARQKLKAKVDAAKARAAVGLEAAAPAAGEAKKK